ncbi:hypothetical protein SLOPH_958 [Spraguea lophii 42_110]|uniref:Uncharacterized protein n=1 Tax=Spraguea lophii (strain 42_110) TaxID=1358809 RepID=S7WAY7_SPRLO|nr:hypothetical protein SLOPH_958 [Spraguea lophii 42_110]
MRQYSEVHLNNEICKPLESNEDAVSLNTSPYLEKNEIIPVEKLDFLYNRLLTMTEPKLFKNLFFFLAENRYFNSNRFFLKNVDYNLLKKLKDESLIKMDKSLINLLKCNITYKIMGLEEHIVIGIQQRLGIIIEINEFHKELKRLVFSKDEIDIFVKKIKKRKIDEKIFYLLSNDTKRITLGILKYYKNKIKNEIIENKKIVNGIEEECVGKVKIINFYKIMDKKEIRKKNLNEIIERLEALYISLSNFLEPKQLY